jgi:hypothetical protein
MRQGPPLLAAVPETGQSCRDFLKFADAGEPFFSLISADQAFGLHTRQVCESLKGEKSCR